jgi:transcription elongation factor Elf1
VSGQEPDDALLIGTIKCKACGKTWIDREYEPGDISPAKRNPEGFIVCSNCGVRNAVWEIGVEKIERRQG